jgi:NAD+ synthase
MISLVLDSTDKVCIDAGFEENTFDKALQKGNMYARMRMITQYAIANKCKGIVLSTENQSEAAQVYNKNEVDNDENQDLAVGQAFFTKYGDAGVDISFIGGCDKGFTIPAMARYLGVPEHIIEKEPSDDLNVTKENTDAAQLHFDYKGVDSIMYGYRGILPKYLQNMFEEIKDNELVKAVIERHERYSFKATPIVNLSRREIGLKMKYDR